MAATNGDVALSFSADMYKKLFPAEYMRKCLASKVRPDSRTIEASRAVQLQTNVIQTAASSSLVKLGNTSVLSAIKLAVGTPAVATPDQGEIAVQVHLSPLCSKRFTVGRPSEESQSIDSQLTRILVGSRVVEMENLSIVKGQSAWKLMVDVYCIDHDGNVLDAALTSIMAALKTLQLPAVSINEADNVVSILPDGDKTPLRMEHFAYATTFAVVDDTVLIDPTSEEEDLASAVFSLTYSTSGQLCGVHKAGGAIVAASVMQQCMLLAKDNTTTRAKLVSA
ncbi:Exosome complex component RRP43 [Phytophthora boehmeriae]|uniref:Exosome complex component RRP43 n=1 Tax=Phytophthora boehmeriae TaxID=109152 RepID=A0A8T1WXC6_9STRA|nr:Exosome complex component RRP43 [Phytophthora boehmeriae]